jgi:hypothetical protein
MPNEITDTSPVAAASAATAQTPVAADPTPANSTNPTVKADPYTSIGAEPGLGGASPVKWQDALPESMREAAGGFASADEAVQAMKRGMDYHPVTSAEEVNLKFPEGIIVDEKQNLAFRELCVKTGLTKAQAQALADWQIESETAMMKAQTESTTEQLKKEWGADYVRRDDLSQRALHALDRQVGGQNELTSALVNSGAWSLAPVRRAFAELGGLMSEDSLSGGRGAATPDVPESPESTYSRFFNRG